MKLLIDAIKSRGRILHNNILKVDEIINHQVDPVLMNAIGDEFYNHFKDKNITKVVTVESSGIAPAILTALKLNVPLLFLKKTQPSTMLDVVTAEVYSYTKNKNYTLCLEKRFINNNDNILFIDDFLANGEAFKGVEKIITEVGAKIVGVGILIDKSFQEGHNYIMNKGYDLYSLAQIISFEDGVIEFSKD